MFVSALNVCFSILLQKVVFSLSCLQHTMCLSPCKISSCDLNERQWVSLQKSYFTSGINCVHCSNKPGTYSVHRIFGFYSIETSHTTPKFCNADCFPQNSKCIFGNKSAALKRQWNSSSIGTILFSPLFNFTCPNLGYDLGFRRIWLLVFIFFFFL